MTDQPGLFDATPWEIPGVDVEPEDLSADRRRTIRQQQNISNGIHPLTHGPLHEQASTQRSRFSGSNDLFTCGTCCHRQVKPHHDGRWPKCDVGPQSRSASTDVRAWWPACPQYLPTRPTAVPTNTEENHPCP